MESTPTRPTALKYGLIMGLVMAAYTLILSLTGQSFNQTLGYVSYVIIIGVIFLAMREYKSLNEGFMTFKQGLGIGVLASLIGGTISSAFSFVYMTFIDPDFIAKLQEFTRSEMEKNQDLSPAQVDQAMEMTSFMMTPGAMFVMGIIGSVILGLIVSLIMSAILKNEPPMEDY
ncbi:MAG: DUF4199 domain-containing protein [Bacteroidota bacterium]